MRKTVVDQVGPLNERFHVGMFEDDDYASCKADHRVICAEDAFVHHQGMASCAKLDDVEYREMFEPNKLLYDESGESRGYFIGIGTISPSQM